METVSPLVNKVANSGLITIDLEEYWNQEPIVLFDLKNYLVKELVLMEKPFREALQEIDWQQYEQKHVAITCTNDALIPMWAYMLVATKAQPFAKSILFGNLKEASEQLLLKNIEQALAPEKFIDAKVILKGCGKNPVPPAAYTLASKLLSSVVKSLMFGEACSSVPVYKKTAAK